jgi:hypothetical protein
MSLSPDEFTFEMQDRVVPLIRACESAVNCGLSRMVLVKKSKRGPRNYDRWRIAPGVFGRCIGSNAPGSWIVDVAVADVVRMLERVMRVRP